MAVAAEQLSSQYFDYISSPEYYVVDQSFYLAGVRAAARLEALNVIDQRREQLRQADYEAVPLPVDALTSAQAVLQARATHGEASPEANERYQGLQLDCQRLLAEAARKNTYEYFPPLKQELDAPTGEYYSHGFSILAMTEAGLTPVAEPEELERRVNERVEEVTYQAIGRLALGEPAFVARAERAKVQQVRRIRTISECPDWAIEAYQNKSTTDYGGYVPEIEKFMVRDVVFDPLTGDRYEEQVGLPGNFITQDILRSVLSARGVEGAEELSKTELHALQLEVDDDLLDFVVALDSVASAKYEATIFMGALISQSTSYESVPAAARQRQAALEIQAAQLAETIMGMAESDIDRWTATGLVGAQVKSLLFTVAQRDIAQAAVMFDEKTASGLKEVAYLQHTGQIAQAQERLEQIEAQAPAPSYCGAGSCGLEKVGGPQASAMKEMGLESAGSLQDTERRCPKCSKKNIVYDLKNKKKGCTNCKSVTGFAKSSK